MTKDGKDILRKLSIKQVARLEQLGATVTETMVTATEEMLWRAGIIGGERSQLLRAGALTIGGTGGGGGGEEIVIDFKNGVYTVDGATVALASLLSDPSYVVDGVGFSIGSVDNPPAPTLVGDARDRIIASPNAGTIVVVAIATSSAIAVAVVANNDDDSNEVVSIVTNSDLGYTVDRYDNSVELNTGYVGGAGALALTYRSTGIAISRNGEPVQTFLGAASPIATQVVLGSYTAGSGVNAAHAVVIEKIIILPEQLDADLPALSAA